MKRDGYPETRREDVLETVGRVTFSDPYRWLEDESPETLAWQAAQDTLAKDHLRGWSGFDRLRASIARYTAPLGTSAPRKAGVHWFRLSTGRHRSTLMVAETVSGPFRSLRACEAGGGEHADSIDWYVPSPDGCYIAYGSSEGGGAQGGAQLARLHVLEVASGRELPHSIPHVAYRAVAWLPGASGFYYVGGTAPANESPERRVFFRDVGDPQTSRVEPLRGLCWCWPQISDDGRYVALVSGTREPRADYILDREGSDGWRPFLSEVPAACFGFFDGDRYIAITTLGTVRGRIVSIPLDSAVDPERWDELIAEGEGVIRSLSRAGDRLVVGDLVDAYARLRLFDLNGRFDSEITLPRLGSVSTEGSSSWLQSLGRPMVAPGDDSFTFIHSSFTSSPSSYQYDVRARRLEELEAPDLVLENYVVCPMSLPAGDGAEIPVKLVYRDDLDLTRPQPTLIYAYGAYNYAAVPDFLGLFAPFVEWGGVFAFAHLRGGGEYGLEWWRAGHHEHKQTSFDDLHAVAEGLIAKRWTTPEKLGVTGLSNGGVNVCVAVAQRPELFKAAVALAPQCDLLRYCRDPLSGGAPVEGHHRGLHVNGGTWRDIAWGRQSLGDPVPRDPRAHFPESQYPDPFAYSPYHNLCDGEHYPATLTVCGSADIWCPPWHGRKFTARLQRANASSNPILLRVWDGAGHSAPFIGEPEWLAEWMGFLMYHLGLESASE